MHSTISFKEKGLKLKQDSMKWLPLILIESYLVFTLLIYQFGLFKWDTQNIYEFWTYLILYHIAFIAGYIWMARKKIDSMEVHLYNKINNVNLIFGILLIIYAVFNVIQYKNTTGSEYSNMINLFQDVWKALNNPGKQYYEANERMRAYGGQKIVTALAGFFSVFSYSIIPIAMYWWDKLSKKRKILFYMLILLNISISVSVGKNSGIFLQLFYFVGSLLLVCFIQGKGVIKKRKILTLFIGLLCMFSFWFFIRGIETRLAGSIVRDVELRSEMYESEAKLVKTSPEKRYDNLEIPQAVENLFYGIEHYLTNGYFMFSLSLSEKVEWCYGLGNSSFLRSNMDTILGIDVSSRMLENKICRKYPEIIYFSSIYTSLANDLHFIGVIVFMLLAGLFTSYIWKDAYFNKDILAYLFLPLLIVFYLYFPVGNIIGNTIYLFFTFFELLFIYIIIKFFNRKRKLGGK